MRTVDEARIFLDFLDKVTKDIPDFLQEEVPDVGFNVQSLQKSAETHKRSDSQIDNK